MSHTWHLRVCTGMCIAAAPVLPAARCMTACLLFMHIWCCASVKCWHTLSWHGRRCACACRRPCSACAASVLAAAFALLQSHGNTQGHGDKSWQVMRLPHRKHSRRSERCSYMLPELADCELQLLSTGTVRRMARKTRLQYWAQSRSLPEPWLLAMLQLPARTPHAMSDGSGLQMLHAANATDTTQLPQLYQSRSVIAASAYKTGL